MRHNDTTMENLKIILNEKGQLESLLSNSELDIQILKRGLNDIEIDEAEATLDIIEFD